MKRIIIMLILIILIQASIIHQRIPQSKTSNPSKNSYYYNTTNSVRRLGRQNNKVIVFVNPDSSFYWLNKTISQAKVSVDIMVYEMWSQDILETINKTASRGVKFRILLEGDTYGVYGENWNRNMSAELYKLNQSGKPIWVRLESTGTLMHAKMAIIDQSIVIIGSENYMPTAYPVDPYNIEKQPYNTPSRGWGAIIYDSTLASECEGVFESIFLDDSKSEDYNPSIHGIGYAPDDHGILDFSPAFSYIEADNVEVSLVRSPINSYSTLQWLIDNANHTIFIEAPYINNESYEIQDLINRLENAVNRGVTVQIILEDDSVGNYYDIGPYLNSKGMNVVPAFSLNNIIFLHNKGIIVDDEYVLMGSINWSNWSLVSNIEMGVLIRSRQIAMFLKDVYSYDWDKSSTQAFDSDGDGLSNCYEDEHNLNPYDSDTDNDGATDYSEVYYYGTDPASPDLIRVEILSPENNSYVSTQNINIQWDISLRSYVTRIEIYVDSKLKATLAPGTSSYSVYLEDQSWHIIKIRPKTNTEFRVISSNLRVCIDTKPPQIQVYSPENNTTVDGPDIQLKINIKDYTSTKVIIEENGTKIYEETNSKNNYNITLNISHSKQGTYIIEITATDNADNTNKTNIIIYIESTQTTNNPKTESTQATTLPIWRKTITWDLFIGLTVIIILISIAIIIVYYKKISRESR